jgi:molybdate transport system substrate-binding protein
MLRFFQFLLRLLIFAALLTGALPARAADTVTVFAAASLKDALDEVGRAYIARTGNALVISYAASSTLARQIGAGAPADVFISADSDWMDYLQTRDLIRNGSRRDLLRNRLVLIAPSNSTAQLKIAPGFPLAAALAGGKLAMAETSSVPAGKYGKAALTSLGVWKDVESSVVSADDVRVALKYVALGEARFGIVYSTDAAVEPRVKVIDTFPETTHPPIVYPAALVVAGKSPEAAAFFTSLSEPAARAIFSMYGFR